MSSMEDYRKLIRGEINTADASAGSPFILYLNGSTVAYTLNPDDRLLIYGFQFFTTNAGRVVLAMDTDTAGKRLFARTMIAGGLVDYVCLGIPALVPVGIVPKLIAPAGQVDGSFWGRLMPKGRNIQS